MNFDPEERARDLILCIIKVKCYNFDQVVILTISPHQTHGVIRIVVGWKILKLLSISILFFVRTDKIK